MAISLVLAIIPLGVALAAPGNVTGIKGELLNGKVHVSWQKPAGEEPVSYRIFYSRASILEQNGLYDDFETVPASSTEFTFASLPYTTPALYVSVLAVDDKGEESPLFMEETRISIDGSAAPAPSSSQTASSVAQQETSSSPAMGNGVVRLLTAKAVSATGVLLTFSHDTEVDPSNAAEAFVIRDASGSTLRIVRMVILGTGVTLHTTMQEQGRVYRLEASASAVMGKDAEGKTLPLDPLQEQVLFSGHETGAPFGSLSSSQPTVSSSVPSAAAQDVYGLNVRGVPMGATYRVEATWQPSDADVREYHVSQTRDGGRTYSDPQIVAPSVTAIKISNVPSGSFGLKVQAMLFDGMMSRGVAQNITLPQLENDPPRIIGPIQAPGKDDELPQTGLALLLPMLAAGAGAGLRIAKQRKQRA